MDTRFNVAARGFRKCFRTTLIVAVSILTLYSVAAKGDNIALVEAVELTGGQAFNPPSPMGVLMISTGIIIVGWLRRRKMA